MMIPLILRRQATTIYLKNMIIISSMCMLNKRL